MADGAALVPLPRAVPEPFLLTTQVFERDEPQRWPGHAHEEHELMWSERGVVTGLAGGRLWVLFPGTGLWIPRGEPHEARAAAGSRLGTTLFAPGPGAPAWAGVVPVRVNRAMQRLLLHLSVAGMPAESRLRAQQVCIDLLLPDDSGAGSVSAPIPTDPRVGELVDAVLADPADGRSLEQWAATLCLSERTVTRIFAEDVAMGFAQWRRRIRMCSAQGLLADGVGVAETGRRVGFATTSAFVASFRREVGRTPGELLDADRAGRGAGPGSGFCG